MISRVPPLSLQLQGERILLGRTASGPPARVFSMKKSPSVPCHSHGTHRNRMRSQSPRKASPIRHP
jgi:hypothetical protein